MVHPKLGRVVSVGVGDVDHYVWIAHDGGVVGHEELEFLRRSVSVEDVEEAGELSPADPPAAVIDRKRIDTGGFSQGDIVGIAAIRGLEGDHVVREDERVGMAAGRSLVMAAMMMLMMSCRHH